jgi:hypothetical protein
MLDASGKSTPPSRPAARRKLPFKNYHHPMKHDLQESSRPHLIQAQGDLMIPTGEFVALLICAVLAVSLLFGLPTFASVRTNIVFASSRPALSLKQSNIHRRNEHTAQHHRLQSTAHNPSANKMDRRCAAFLRIPTMLQHQKLDCRMRTPKVLGAPRRHESTLTNRSIGPCAVPSLVSALARSR